MCHKSVASSFAKSSLTDVSMKIKPPIIKGSLLPDLNNLIIELKLQLE